MHEWGHWYVLKDADSPLEVSFVTFPFHFKGKANRDIKVGDVNKAR
jgi:hypothetical protein